MFGSRTRSRSDRGSITPGQPRGGSGAGEAPLTDRAWAAAESFPEAPRWLVRLQELVAYWDDRVGRLRMVAFVTLCLSVASVGVCFAIVMVVSGVPSVLNWQYIVIPVITAWIMTPLTLLPVLRILAYTRELGERYRLLAQHDPLTGALNRHGLFDAEQLPRVGDLVVVADIDRFKVVNDVHGHSVGDELLIAVCQQLRAHFGPQARICRAGGDEFIVVTDSAMDIPDSLTVELRDITARISLGSKVMSEPGVAGLDGARAAADQMMYRAKRSTRTEPVRLSGHE